LLGFQYAKTFILALLAFLLNFFYSVILDSFNGKGGEGGDDEHVEGQLVNAHVVGEEEELCEDDPDSVFLGVVHRV